MAETIENLRIQLNFETGKWKQQTASAGKDLDRLNHRFNTTSKQADKARASMRGFGTAITGLISLHMGRELLNTALAFDRMENRMKFATRGAGDFNNMMRLTEKTASDLGLSLLDVQRGFSTISASARGSVLEGQPVIELFKGVSQASAALGLTADETNSVFTAFGQIISKGTVQAEELRGQIGERLPQAFEASARAMNVTKEELGDMLRRGELMAEDLLPKLAVELQKTFGDQAIKNASSLTAQMNRLSNETKTVTSTLTKWVLENSAIVNALSKTAEQIEASRMEADSAKDRFKLLRKEVSAFTNQLSSGQIDASQYNEKLRQLSGIYTDVARNAGLGEEELAKANRQIEKLTGFEARTDRSKRVFNADSVLKLNLEANEKITKEKAEQVKLDQERLRVSKLIAKATFDSPLFTEYRDSLKDQEESANRFLKNTEAQQMAQAKARAEILRQQKIREDEMRTDKALLSQAEKKLDILKEQEKVLRRTSGVNFLQSARSGSNADIRASIEARTVALGGADFNEDLLERNLAEQEKQSELLKKIEKRLNVERV